MGFSDRVLKVLSDQNAQEIFANIDVEFSDIDAGKSGSAGTVDIFPSTASKGKLRLSMVDNTNDVTTTITNKAQAAAQTYSVPDCAADADFVMDELAQTIAGVKTHTDNIVMNTADLLIGDTDSLDFGDASGGDVAIAWDNTNLTIIPAADNTGQIIIGNGTADIDVLFTLGAANEDVLFDVSAGHVEFDGVELNMGDNDEIEFGDGQDARMQWNATLMEFGPGAGMWGNAPTPGMSDYETVCVKFFDDFLDDTIPVATRWTITEDNAANTQVIEADSAIGIMTLAVVNTTDNEGHQINFTQENFRFATGKQLWFETRIRCAAGDATNLDFFVGMAAAEDITGVADNMPANGFGFRKDDGDANIDLFTSDGGSNVEQTSVDTLVDNTWVELGLHFDGSATGSGVITPYADGVAGTAITTAAYATMVEVAPMFMIRNGDGTTAQKLEIDYVKLVQLR